MSNGMSLRPKVPPAFESREDINPTLLMSWWATGFSVIIIVVRLCGRYVRVERFFTEDKVMMLSLIPLAIRMVFVHFVLTLGTNNVQTAGLTAHQVTDRELGSKLVLCARIFYAIFIWTAKLTVCEFLKRVTGVVWRKSVAIFLRFIHFFLASTLIAVVIATLAECVPFDHYWQVIPDPGPSCRCGYAQLITMAATAVSNALVIGSFVRDRGAKKLKYKRHLGSASVTESVDGSYMRRNTVMQKQWGSDCDLAADLGMRLDPDLCPKESIPSDATSPVQAPSAPIQVARTGSIDHSWSFRNSRQAEDDCISITDSLDRKISPHDYIGTSKTPREREMPTPSTVSSRRVSFFDVGGSTQPEPE
ncbi:hypothetical protein N7470_009210 [Penicillium chermesinum]|nr:hypothetical protein N7470_009210 [Penicillium chermesinum]